MKKWANIRLGIDCFILFLAAFLTVPILNVLNVISLSPLCRYPGSRVRVSVPNCAHLSLVMWIICQNDTLRGYDIDDNLVHARATMLKFVIARGFNLQERSHGLIGIVISSNAL